MHLEGHPFALPGGNQFMSSEPLATTPVAADATDVASAEKGLLIVVLLMVLLGVSAMLFMF
jgi:hypothetical protein